MAISDADVWHQVHAQREDGVAAMFLIRDVEPRADQPKIFVVELPYAVTDLSGQPDAAGYRRLGAFQEQWLEPACTALGWTFVAWKSEDGSFFLYLYGAGDPDALLEKLAPFDGELGFFNDLDADWSEYAALRELVEQAEADADAADDAGDEDDEDDEDEDDSGEHREVADDDHVHTAPHEHDHDHPHDHGHAHDLDAPSQIRVVDLTGAMPIASHNGESHSAPARSMAKAAPRPAAAAPTRGTRASKPAAKPARTAAAASKPAKRAAAPAQPRRPGAAANKPAKRAAAASKPPRSTAGKPSKPAPAGKPSKSAPAGKPPRRAATASKPAKRAAATSKPAQRSTAPNKPAKRAAATSKPAQRSTAPNKPAKRAAANKPAKRATPPR